MIPDRLPSLIVLVGFWIPPAVAGWVAAGLLQRGAGRVRAIVTYLVLAIFVLVYGRRGFSSTVVASALVLPGSVIASVLAFRIRGGRSGACLVRNVSGVPTRRVRVTDSYFRR